MKPNGIKLPNLNLELKTICFGIVTAIRNAHTHRNKVSIFVVLVLYCVLCLCRKRSSFVVNRNIIELISCMLHWRLAAEHHSLFSIFMFECCSLSPKSIAHDAAVKFPTINSLSRNAHKCDRSICSKKTTAMFLAQVFIISGAEYKDILINHLPALTSTTGGDTGSQGPAVSGARRQRGWPATSEWAWLSRF